MACEIFNSLHFGLYIMGHSIDCPTVRLFFNIFEAILNKKSSEIVDWSVILLDWQSNVKL